MNNEMDRSSLLAAAIEITTRMDHTVVTIEHVLIAALTYPTVTEALQKNRIRVDVIVEDIFTYLKNNNQSLQSVHPLDPNNGVRVAYTEEVQQIFKDHKENLNIAQMMKKMFNDTESYASYFLRKHGVKESMFDEMDGKETFPSTKEANVKALSEYCVNLNEHVKNSDVDALVGRKHEIFRIAHTLVKRRKSNAVLIGEPGVGKSAIVEGLAMQINADNVPEPLKGKVIFKLDIGSLLAGSRYRGDYEEKIKNILTALRATDNAILYIDEAESMDDSKNSGGVGFSAMFKPELSRGGIKMIAATTMEGYRRTFEKDTALMRRFNVVTVDEPTPDEAIKILEGIKESTEKFHGVTISSEAIKASVDMTVKYQSNLRLPDKAIDIIDSACARTKVLGLGEVTITRDDIIKEITDVTGIKIKGETTEEKKVNPVLSFKTKASEKVHQQSGAIDEMYKALVRASAGVRDENRPIGRFLFVGPTGTGKTFLAQTVAEIMDMPLVRYNMSEYMEQHSVSKLIGASPNYVGYGDGMAGEGALINDGTKHRNAVFLIDEVEKAHPDVFNIFLQIFDEGKLTGGSGKVADFRNSIFIMTSNLGAQQTAEKKNFGFGVKEGGMSESTKAVNQFFRPELRGRLTAVIEFNPLNEVTYRTIAVEKIRGLRSNSEDNITLNPTEDLVSHIMELNKTSKYGAREISKIVEDIIGFPLALKILNGEIQKNAMVNLGWDGENITIEPEEEKKKSSRKKAVEL